VRKEGGKRIVRGTRAIAPLVSIISVVYRDCSALVPLMESIFAHATGDTEIIVIDGGSSDGTVELLQSWSDKIDYWLSEKDTGIYDAMNKGIATATGEYILHLNAGDTLQWIPSAHLMQCKLDRVDVVCFDVLIDRKKLFHSRVGFILRIDNCWHHQGTFYRRSCHPGYDISYKVFSDFDVNQRLYQCRCTLRMFPGTVSGFSTGGASSRDGQRKEIYRIIRKNYGVIYVPIAFVRYQMWLLLMRITRYWRLRFGR
jgi:glycosyltransferase involved in cell wall biosynthesis